MAHSSGLHHYHLRKRIHQKHEKYPHPNKSKALIDKFVYIAAIGGPLIILPQIYKVLIEKTVEGVSSLTWGGASLVALLWLSYGIAHKDKPIIIANVLYFVFQTAIFLGVILN